MCIFFQFLLSQSHRVSICPSVHPSLCVIVHISKISEMWSVPIFKQQGHACRNCPDVQTWPALPMGGCRLTDIKGSDRRTDPERKPVAMLMKHRLSTTVLSVAGSAKLGGSGWIFLFNGQASFSTPVESGHCHLSLSSWAVENILEQEMKCGIMPVMSRITVMGQWVLPENGMLAEKSSHC